MDVSRAAPPARGERSLLEAYLATTWRVTDRDGEIRLRIGVPVPPPFRVPAAILTACNPASLLRPEAENRAADERLRGDLLASGGEIHRATALGHGSDARHWDEPGYLVRGLPLSTIVALGERYLQNAAVWIGEDAVPRLVATRAGFVGATPGQLLHHPHPEQSDARP